MIALRKRAEIDSKHIITFIPNDPSELKQSLNRHVISFNNGRIVVFQDSLCIKVFRPIADSEAH